MGRTGRPRRSPPECGLAPRPPCAPSPSPCLVSPTCRSHALSIACDRTHLTLGNPEVLMNNRIVHRHPSWLVLLPALICGLVTTPARSAVLMKDAPADEGSSTVTNAGNWEALAVSSAKSRIESDDKSLSVVLAPGDRASFSRTADLAPEPSAVLVTFNVSLSDLGTSRATTQVFRLGWDFGGSVGDESDARTYARLGLTTVGTKYKLVDLMGGNTSPAIDGTQAVSWAINNSGRTYSYSAPDGSIETLA